MIQLNKIILLKKNEKDQIKKRRAFSVPKVKFSLKSPRNRVSLPGGFQSLSTRFLDNNSLELNPGSGDRSSLSYYEPVKEQNELVYIDREPVQIPLNGSKSPEIQNSKKDRYNLSRKPSSPLMNFNYSLGAPSHKTHKDLSDLLSEVQTDLERNL